MPTLRRCKGSLLYSKASDLSKAFDLCAYGQLLSLFSELYTKIIFSFNEILENAIWIKFK